MKVYIDTSHSEVLILKVDGEVFETESKRDKSQALLPFLESILSAKGKKLFDITELEVNTGPGSYTGLRVGLAIVQTLGWLLHMPVNGKYISKGEFVQLHY